MAYMIGCQDCDETGKILKKWWIWYWNVTCPTCKGATKVPFGTRFKGTYDVDVLLKPAPRPLPATYAQERGAGASTASNDSGYRSNTNSSDDGPGIGTVLIAAALLSNNSTTDTNASSSTVSQSDTVSSPATSMSSMPTDL